jgi:hypothetical protein
MGKLSLAKIILLVATVFLVLSIILSVVSLFPVVTSSNQKVTVVKEYFKLSQNEVYRIGLGTFHGGENISVRVDCQNSFMKNFSIVTYNGTRYANYSNSNIVYSFTTSADYYDAVFISSSPNSSWVHFEVILEKPQVFFPFSTLTVPARIMFLLSIVFAIIIMLKLDFPKVTERLEKKTPQPSISKPFCNCLLILVILSSLIWLSLLAVNSNPLATFENWYTDHVRHAYVSSLFLKDGLSVFSQPLGALANQDYSRFIFVTWPEMPHFYPIGSILLFLPFGVLLQNGFNPVMVYKLEIALFLVFAHLCLYFFLKVFLSKDMHLTWKLVGVYIAYLTLVIYAANGMFDSIAFLFALFAVTMFLRGHYDGFFLLVGISLIIKYQAGVFLLPLIIIGALKIIEKNKPEIQLLRNKVVIVGAVFVLISLFTAALSAPSLIQTRPELILNSINAFAPHAQVSWTWQSLSVLLTLATTLVYAFYMLNKNVVLSILALTLLGPSFMLPYFQNWYLPFIFVYVLIPQRKKEIEATMIWLIFMIALLSFGGFSFNPLQIIDNLRYALKI